MTQPFGDSGQVGAEGLPRAAAGEQPRRVVVTADGGVAESGIDELAQEIVERCWDEEVVLGLACSLTCWSAIWTWLMLSSLMVAAGWA